MRIPEGRLLVAKAGRMVEHARRGLRGLSAGVLALGVGCLLMTAFVIATEEQAVSAFLVLVVFGGMSGLVFAIVRRPGFAFIAITAFFISTFVASAFKFNFVAMNLHVYDAVFYLFSVAQLSFFAQTFQSAAFGLVAGLIVTFGALALAWRADRARVLGRSGLALALIVSLGAIACAGGLLVQRGSPFFNENQNVYSAFIASFGDLPALSKARGFLEISAQASLAPGQTEAIVCNPTTNPPDIVLTLNESAMPPGVYPQLAFPPEARPLFESFDKRIHKLRVETFGGGTWLSDFSALTGLSTNMFGGMRNFALQLTAGRLRHTLPQYLKACGYDTTLIYPSLAEFAGSARFYRAIGFDKVIDRQAHKAPDERQRDAFYYDQVRKVFDAARSRENARPQFIVVSSMSTHSPWNFRFAPEAVKPGDNMRWTGNAEFDEYLWRLVLAKRDRDAFRASLAKNYPGKPFLFVGYGDHQPALARLPLENALELADKGSAWQLDPASRAFETYYSIEGLGFTPAIAMPDAPIIEIPHLATIAVAAAGLPLDSVYQRRWWLMGTCKGLYTSCADKGAVMGFQRWLADSGWMAQR
jgi:hypothetical protein